MAEGDITTTKELTIKETVSHFVRISSGGKIKRWVDFSLRFLRENPGTPLILHTLPTNPPNDSLSTVADSPDGQTEPSEQRQASEQFADPEATSSALPASARNIPRLISVVEIIKREYFKSLPPGPQSTGIYQYNYLGSVDTSTTSLDTNSAQEDQRRESIIASLEGKNHLKVEKTPYMSITLCTKELSTIDRQTTCQLPSVKRLSRSAKARDRRKRLRVNESNDA